MKEGDLAAMLSSLSLACPRSSKPSLTAMTMHHAPAAKLDRKASQEVRRKESQGLETAGKYPKMDTRNVCFIQPESPAL